VRPSSPPTLYSSGDLRSGTARHSCTRRGTPARTCPVTLALAPSGAALRIEGSQDSTGSCSRPHDTRPVLHLGPDLFCASRALCPYAPGEPSTHSPVGTRSFPAPTPDEPVGRQTTGLRLPRYSRASREGDRPVALSRSWKRMPPLALDGSACHRRPDGHQVAPSSAQGQLPITNCWARNQGQSRCRIAKSGAAPRRAAPDSHVTRSNRTAADQPALTQSSRLSDSPRAWCSSHTGWTIFTPEDLVICQRQVSVSQTPTPSLYSRMCSKTLAPIFWETS